MPAKRIIALFNLKPGEDVATPVMQAVAKDFSGMAEVTFILVEKIAWEPAA